MANILLLTRGTGGDFYPFLCIGRALQARGHTATLITHRHYAEATRHAGLAFVALDPSEDLAHTGDQAVARTLPDLLADLREGLATIGPACERFGKLLRSGPAVLLANHNSFVAAQIFSEKHHAPLVSLFVAPAFVSNMPVHEELYRLAGADINRVRASLDLSPVRDWRAWWRSVRWSIGIWPEWFAAREAIWPAGLTPVGFVFETEPAGVLPAALQTILDGGVRPILITHGTSVPPKPEFFPASVAACRRLGLPCVLVTPHADCVPALLPNGAYWFKSLPFATLMPHLAAVIHHGGIGTAGTALSAGIPQVVLPMGIDRPDNALRLQHLGVGVHLPPAYWNPDALVAALEPLLASTAVREHCAALKEKFRGMDPLAGACDVIEAALRGWGETSTPAAPVADGSSEDPEPLPAAHPIEEKLSAERRALLALQLRRNR